MLPRLVCMISIVVSVLSPALAETAADRGFDQPAAFTRGLEANPATSTAADRTTPSVEAIALKPATFEITRQSTRTIEFELTTQPLLARLSGSVWHLGTTKHPPIRINGKDAGFLAVVWPSLSQRNYIRFMFDDSNASSGMANAIDYQGWLPIGSIIDGPLLHSGKNTLQISVATDQIMLKDMQMEVLNSTDTQDTTHDFRSITRKQQH